MRRIGLAVGSGAAVLAVLAGCSSNDAVSLPNNGGQQAGGGQSSPAFTDMAMLVNTVSQKQAAAKTTTFHIAGTLAGQQISGDGVADLSQPGSPATQTTMHLGGRDLGIVLKDKVIYLKSVVPVGGKPWVKLDTTHKDPMSAMFGQALSQTSDSADPTKSLQQLKDTGKITGSKPETLDGQQTTHYTATVDVRKLVRAQFEKVRQAAGGKLPQGTEQSLDKTLAKMPATLPAEMWLNDQQLPVKYSMSVPSLGADSGAGNQPATLVTTYKDWGKPVTVTVPPADQVGDLSGLSKQIAGAGGASTPRTAAPAQPGG